MTKKLASLSIAGFLCLAAAISQGLLFSFFLSFTFETVTIVSGFLSLLIAFALLTLISAPQLVLVQCYAIDLLEQKKKVEYENLNLMNIIRIIEEISDND